MRRFAVLLVLAAQFSVVPMADAATGPLDRVLRRIGIGWSPGYHAPEPNCVMRNSLPYNIRGGAGCARCRSPFYGCENPYMFGPCACPPGAAPWELLHSPDAYDVEVYDEIEDIEANNDT